MQKNKSHRQRKNPSDCVVEGKEWLNPVGDDDASKLRQAMRHKPLEVRTLQT